MLELIGSIERCEDPIFPLATWREVIEAFALLPIESFQSTNPFTGQPITFDTPLELAAVMVDGQRVGVVRWCSRGGGLDIFGNVDAMTPLAEAIAVKIGGDFVPL